MKGVKTVENGTKNPCFLTKISFFREISIEQHMIWTDSKNLYLLSFMHW